MLTLPSEMKSPPNADTCHTSSSSAFVRDEQVRLIVGPLTLVMADQTRWAMPCGGAATYGDLTAWAQQQGWRRPELVRVTVRRRVEALNPVCLGPDVVDVVVDVQAAPNRTIHQKGSGDGSDETDPGKIL